tara:strand:- start:1860 stop:2063 length:204 start_codon:yes stop_codon:yes gene_type:complete
MTLNTNVEIIFNQGRLKENLNFQKLILKSESLSELCRIQISNYLRENQFYLETLIKNLENQEIASDK